MSQGLEKGGEWGLREGVREETREGDEGCVRGDV